jgi:ABC-2 type transport system ATP-binding protein
MANTQSVAVRSDPVPPVGGAADAAIVVRGLRMSYGAVEAVKGVDLEVGHGEVFAFLGPNGAGKTTTVEILEGFRQRSHGEVRVLGVDPARGTSAWRDRLGIVLQSSTPEPDLTVEETLELYAGFYSRPRPAAEVLALTGLTAQAGVRNRRLSGGQQRRLDLALALVGDPDLLFLDEPTTGFDPAARRAAWEAIAGLRALGKTIFLTTHYLDEAEFLADRIAVINGGLIVATGTPRELGGRNRRPTAITFRPWPDLVTDDLPAGLGRSAARLGDGRVRLETADPTARLLELTTWALGRGQRLDELEVIRPSLEDTYLELTKGVEP